MKLNLLQILHTITPAETHFVAGETGYLGVLSFWIIALVQNEDETATWLSEFPIVADGITSIQEQIEDDSRMVLHWSEMRQYGRGLTMYSEPELQHVVDLVDRLWGAT